MTLLRMTVAIAVLLRASLAFATPQDVAELVRSGDAHYETRADGHAGEHPSLAPVEDALRDYRQALVRDPGDLEVYWRLIRAISFKGEYAISDRKEKQVVFKEGLSLAAEAMKSMEAWAAREGQPRVRNLPLKEQAEVFKKMPGAAPYFFWTGAVWGQWALAFGKMAAARQGAAGKIRDFSTLAILTDDKFEGGGGYRVLGRLHHQSPHIPLITGWVSRKEALANLAKAYGIAPDYKFNPVYYAEALYDDDRARRGEAVAMLKKVLSDPPSPERLVEDLHLHAVSRSLLQKWGEVEIPRGH